MTTQTNPIELYNSATPNGRKITIMLEELGVPYDIHYIRFSTRTHYTPEFTAISPNNKIPAIVDPEGPGGAPISIFESGAILQYLGRKFGRFYPAGERERVEVELEAALFAGIRRGVLIAEGIHPNAAHAGGRGINTLIGADPVRPFGGVAFHDCAVRIRPA